MELFTTIDNVIIHNKEENESLWCNRADCKLIPVAGCKLPEAWNPVCRGLVYGVIGKMQLLPGSEWKLLVISERHFVGYLPGGVEVYQIVKVGVASLSAEVLDVSDLNLLPCPNHKVINDENYERQDKSTQQKVQRTWNNFKISANQITEKTNQIFKDDDVHKIERKLFDELVKMFNESGSFYYSLNGDISNTRQRLESFTENYNWRQTDDRFFWNKYMLSDLINLEDPSASVWIIPIMQGFVQIERCVIDHLEYLNGNGESDSIDGLSEDDDMDMTETMRYRSGENLKEDEYDLILISRRGRQRAGTRYNRRGVDEHGEVANYVETEQILCVLSHTISHVQLRGSVPVFWSQPGVKYKPLPIINRNFAETKEAFAKHFDKNLGIYGNQVLINLVELTGREKTIGDAFLEHIYEYNSDNLTYITFDFHEYCRGMKFENVSVLINVVEYLMDQMGYYWTDQNGVILEQSSVFRVNCMDCLDRTNVVQAAIARSVMNTLLRRLGRLLPEETLPQSCRRVHNIVWANNGDAISRQYAGTAAMKGDFTRTGERNLTGMMKDGYNSANRYYLNRFKDIYRQAVIDMMLGNAITEQIEDLVIPSKSTQDEEWTYDKEESITQLVRHTEFSLLQPNEECYGGWALVDPYTFAVTGSNTDQTEDEDIILLLTPQAYYIARYSDVTEEIHSYQRMPITSLEKIEIGMESGPKVQYTFMRIYHRYANNSGFFHSIRTIQQRSNEESRGILMSIAEAFLTLCRNQGVSLRITETRLDKKRTKPHQGVRTLSSKTTIRSSSRVDDAEYLAKEINGSSRSSSISSSSRKDTLKPSLSLSDISGVPEIHINNEESGFLKLHQQHSPNLKKEQYKDEPPDLFPPVGERAAMASSSSDGQISNLTASNNRMPSRMDAILKKTKTAISNVGPKFRNISNNNSDTSSNDDSEPRDTEPRDTEPRDTVFNFNMSPMKNTLQKMNSKFLNRSGGDFKNPLKIFPEFRNKIQTALTPPKEKVRIISEEEKEKRVHCKTKIIDL